MRKRTLAAASLGLSMGLAPAADFPEAEIGNGVIRVKIYLPGATNGFYRGTRFDWSGVIHSLEYKGHDYYGPWFNKTDPKVHDFVFRDADIVPGPCSAITGPVDEFKPLGWEDAKAGGNFVKIGVGALRKPNAAAYDNYRLYEIANPGKRTIRKRSSAVEFTQELNDASSGYAHVYRKVVRLARNKPEMTLEHSLKNTGARTIQTSVYNHNFLVLDKQTTGPDFTITVPFEIRTGRRPNKSLAEIRGNQVVYLKTLEDRDTVFFRLEGFGTSPKDHEIRIENRKLGAGVKITADRPLAAESLWSIRTVISMEPFIAIDIGPGKEFTWTSTYEYYTLPSGK